jgi:ACT domain-containing protein
VHHHENHTPRGTIPVQVVFEIEYERLDELIARLEESGVGVTSVGEQRFLEHGAVILIGHIVKTDIKETINIIDNTGFAEVVDMTLSMPRIDMTSSAFMKIDAVGKKELSQAISLLNEVAAQKDLLVIETIGSGVI